jgi:hypothetical protein
MTPTKTSNSSPQASPRIACYGTVFLSDSPIDTAALKRGIASDVPQFSSPRLDASFLANCGSFLSGKTATMDDPRAYFRRVAGTDFRLPKATHFCQLSAELSDLLAALTDERAADIAVKWYDMNGPAKTKPRESNGRTQRRFEILKNLATLAKQAKAEHKALMLRVEYQKQR